MVNESADVAVQPDQLGARHDAIVQTAKQMGVTDLVHYSFPRHMSRRSLLARRRDAMKQAAAAVGSSSLRDGARSDGQAG